MSTFRMIPGTMKVLTLAAVALSSACGSGVADDASVGLVSFSTSSGTVSLSTKEDVIRELGTFATLHRDYSTVQPASSLRAHSSGARRLMPASTSVQAGEGHPPKDPKPAGEETMPCDGGSVTEAALNGARDYPLFDVTPASTAYAVSQFHDCVDNGDPWIHTTSGRHEAGSSEPTAGAPEYFYEAQGSGGTPYTEVSEDASTGERHMVQRLGRTEIRVHGEVWQSRQSLTTSLEATFEGDTYRLTVGVGEDGNPLVVTDDYSSSTLTIDGPLHYSSSFCEGGRVEYTTLQPLTFGSDAFGGFVNGGQVVIEAGASVVTVTFQGDGGASYQLNSGASGTIARDEMPAASECMEVPDGASR